MTVWIHDKHLASYSLEAWTLLHPMAGFHELCGAGDKRGWHHDPLQIELVQADNESYGHLARPKGGVTQQHAWENVQLATFETILYPPTPFGWDRKSYLVFPPWSTQHSSFWHRIWRKGVWLVLMHSRNRWRWFGFCYQRLCNELFFVLFWLLFSEVDDLMACQFHLRCKSDSAD